MENLPKLTVSELTAIIKQTLEGSFFGLTVEGEISGFKPASTGHWYFSLKDQNSLIGAAVWRSNVPRIGFVPKDGQKVVVTGYISVYEPRGSYQLICTSMRPSGEGDILAQLEERKKYYASLGWFDESLKKSIPSSPSKLAVITSPTGAALQDILQITGRRSNTMDIIILPATVQGENAGESIAKRIEEVNKFMLADVMIVGRGGGSLEDLLPFSEDCVIKAIHDSKIPVISAVGHEIDWALSDFVADLRAPTPSAAAELVCERTSDRKEKLLNSVSSLHKAIASKTQNARLMLAFASDRNLKNRLDSIIANSRMHLDSSVGAMGIFISKRLSEFRNKTDTNKARLESLSPFEILKRGYSIVTDSSGKTIKEVDLSYKGKEINIRFNKGNARAKILEANDEV